MRWPHAINVDKTCMPCQHANAVVSSKPLHLSHASAYCILPIAHQYDMRAVLERCFKAVKQAPLPLGPTGPALETSDSNNSSSNDRKQPPTLFDWLELADAKQCTPLLDTVLEHLCKSAVACNLKNPSKDSALPVVRSALANASIRQRLQHLSPEASMKLLNVTAGLPVGFQVGH